MKTKPFLFYFLLFIFLLHTIFISTAGAANKFMPLGDSITQGLSSGVADEAFQVSYRKALYDKLKAAGYVVNDEIFVGSLFSGELVADFDPDHDGHPGWRAEEIVAGRSGSGKGKLSNWLMAEKPNIVLLHIGTNDVSNSNEDWNEVEDILDVIDAYETASGKAVWVVLALIIDRSCDLLDSDCLTQSANTTSFNNDVKDFVFFPRQAGADKILLVDMQNDAGINYDLWNLGGDMWDKLHPFKTGYEKMADLWFSGLQQILPQADAGPDQDVNEFDTVTLDASGSMDPKGGSLSYKWVQTSGTPVVLSDAQAAQPTFVAPDSGCGVEILTFRVTVTDEDKLESADTVSIEVIFMDNCPFSDVPPGYWAEEAIYKIYDEGITNGCSQNPLMFCPKRDVKRWVAAVLIGRAIHGSDYTPPSATGIFEDVLASHPYADWMEQFYADGITNGCQKSPLMFCPDKLVQRWAAAVLLLRAKHGSSYVPPPATGLFNDVPLAYWWADWAEQFYREGITKGCLGNSSYFCPEKIVTREIMAVLIVRTFGL